MSNIIHPDEQGGKLQPGEMHFANYFGPPILQAELPTTVLEKITAIVDGLIGSDTAVSYGANLAGAIQEELAIPKQDLKEAGIYNYFEEIGKRFVILSSFHLSENISEDEQERLSAQITDMWLVRQRENEYNPLHLHTRCTISAVMYIRVPEIKSRDIPFKNNESSQDGKITFVHKSAGDPVSSFERSHISIQPKVGSLYMFPSTMLHAVWPFIGDGERISVSFNMIHSTRENKKQEPHVSKKESQRTKWFYPKRNIE